MDEELFSERRDFSEFPGLYSAIGMIASLHQRTAFAEHIEDIPLSLEVSGIPVRQILLEHQKHAALYETAVAMATEYRKERARAHALPSPIGEPKKPGPRPRHCPKTLGICYSRVLAWRKPSETNIDVLTDRVLNAYLEEVKATAPHSHYREWVRAWLRAYFMDEN